MRDESAHIEDRMAAAIALAPIMHRPMPLQYVSPEEADQMLTEALRR
jgi:hypothetical protein